MPEIKTTLKGFLILQIFLLASAETDESNSAHETDPELSTSDKNNSFTAEHTIEQDQESRDNDEPGFDLTPEEMEAFKIWRGGVVPYYIDVQSFYDKALRDKIRNCLQLVNSLTSVSFVELTSPPLEANKRFVMFINRMGLLDCADHTVKSFTNEGVQRVVLGYDCMETKLEIEEAVMSILGIPAQHNAPDRDFYITVNMDNIIPEKQHLFEKLNDNEWLFHDLQYDLSSVTHYDINKYSANGQATIEIKDTTEYIRPRKFSELDIKKIKMLYNFITRNNVKDLSLCKMFKVNTNVEPRSETSANLTPREKPDRYLSGFQGASLESAGHNSNSEHSEPDTKSVGSDR